MAKEQYKAITGQNAPKDFTKSDFEAFKTEKKLELLDNPFYAIANEAEREKMKADPDYKPESNNRELMLHLTANEQNGEVMLFKKDLPRGMTGNPLLEMHQEYNDVYSEQLKNAVKYTVAQKTMMEMQPTQMAPPEPRREKKPLPKPRPAQPVSSAIASILAQHSHQEPEEPEQMLEEKLEEHIEQLEEPKVDIVQEKGYYNTEPEDWTDEMTTQFYREHPECYQEYYQ